MRFRSRRKLSRYDIPIASVLFKPVSSRTVLQMIDYSGSILGNTVAAVSSIISSPEGSGTTASRLTSLNIFGNIELTDSFHYDPLSGRSSALWYAHNVKRPVFNDSRMARQLRKRIRTGKAASDRIVKGLLSANRRLILILDSVTVRDLGTGSYLSRDQFHVDYARGEVALLQSAVTEGREYLIAYETLDSRIQVENGSALVRLEMERVSANLNYYILRILSDSRTPLRVRYLAEKENGEIDEFEELTFASRLFSEVPETLRAVLQGGEEYGGNERRVYSIVSSGDDRYIWTTSRSSDAVFCFRSEGLNSTRIHLNKPVQQGFESCWSVGIQGGSFSGPLGDFQITLRENVDDYDTVSERAIVLNRNTIAVSGRNLLFYIDPDHEVAGITAIDQNGRSLSIESVDPYSGTIYLVSEVASTDIVYVTYSLRKDYVELGRPLINPLEEHLLHNGGIRRNALLFCLADTAGSSDRIPVYVKALPLYSGEDFINYTLEALDLGGVNSPNDTARIAFRADMGLPENLAQEDHYLEILGLIYAMNPLDEDGYLLEDARIYGGGTDERHRSFHDFSLYDGEAVDLECSLRVHVRESVFTALEQRALLWDPEIAKLSSAEEKSEAAREAARRLVRDKVKKFSQLGTVQEIIVG